MKVYIAKGTMTSRPGLPAYEQGLDLQQYTVMALPCGCQQWRYETPGRDDVVRGGPCDAHRLVTS